MVRLNHLKLTVQCFVIVCALRWSKNFGSAAGFARCCARGVIFRLLSRRRATPLLSPGSALLFRFPLLSLSRLLSVRDGSSSRSAGGVQCAAITAAATQGCCRAFTAAVGLPEANFTAHTEAAGGCCDPCSDHAARL